MKKNLLCLILVFSMGAFVSAQVNLLENGDMEEQGAWKVSQGNLADTIAFEFGSTTDVVNGGDGGNLAISVTALGTDNTNLTVYQAVDLVGGKEYEWSCAMRDLSAGAYGCWWIKFVWIALEPVDGTDPAEEGIAQMHEWLTGKILGFDGLFDTCTAAIVAESKDNIFTPEADGTYYVGINFGTCNTEAYHFLIDEVALIDPDAQPGALLSPRTSENTLEFYPNPASNSINFSYSLKKFSDVEVTIVDMLGNEIARHTSSAMGMGEYTESFDCSELPNGVYFGVLRANNSITTERFVISR